MKKADRTVHNKLQIEKKTKIVDVIVSLWKHKRKYKGIKFRKYTNLQRLLSSILKRHAV
jgi:hypothetical protein